MNKLNQTLNTSGVKNCLSSCEFHINIENEILLDKALLQKYLQVVDTLRREYLFSLF